MIIVVMGVSGSGKTTVGRLLADRLGWIFHDADDFHSDTNRKKMAGGQALMDADRTDWLLALRELLASDLEADRPAVLACSALKESYRERLKVNDRVCFVYLRGTYRQIEERMMERTDHYMKPKMLKSQFEILEEPRNVPTIDITHSPDEMVQFICCEFGL